ncbi:hypothetical protein V6Z11_A05G223900 [Gossypium hirsutum]
MRTMLLMKWHRWVFNFEHKCINRRLSNSFLSNITIFFLFSIQIQFTFNLEVIRNHLFVKNIKQNAAFLLHFVLCKEIGVIPYPFFWCPYSFTFHVFVSSSTLIERSDDLLP